MSATPESDLERKLRLEASLLGKAKSLSAALAQRLRRDLGKGSVPDLRGPGVSVLEPTLLDHYGKISDEFDHDLTDQMPSDVAVTDSERNLIRSILDAAFVERSVTMSRFVMENAQSLAVRSVQRADDLIEKTDTLTREDRSTLAANIFLRQQLARSGTLACYETQWAAERAKGVEVSVLTGQEDLELKTRQRWSVKVDASAIKTWRSQGDSRVRTRPDSKFDHLFADGQKVNTDEPFQVSGDLLRWPGDTSLGARLGNVIGCFLADVRVDADAVSAQRAFYDGEICRIEVPGSVLSVTPNHPIATPSGFVAAGDLRECDYVLADRSLVENPGTLTAAIRKRDEDDGPPSIEDLFRSMRESPDTFRTEMVARADDFYGDGRFLKGEIDIVTTDCKLLDRFESMSEERFLDEVLVQEAVRHVSLPRSRHSVPIPIWMESAARCVVRSFHLAVSFMLRHLRPLQGFGTRLTSQRDTARPQNAVNRSTTDPHVLRELLNASPFEVTPLKILSVDRDRVVTHVYDVSTRSGLLAANGIIASNCRCSAIYDVEEVSVLRRLILDAIVEEAPNPFVLTESDLIEQVRFEPEEIVFASDN